MIGKIIVITGASSGIGFKTAEITQELGATVVWASRNIEKDENVLRALSEKSLVKNLDVSKESSVVEFFDFVKDKHPKVDAIINCAGFVIPEVMYNTSLENWSKTIDINLTGTFLMSKYGTKLMKDKGGKLINIASTAGLTPRPGWGAYAAAKSGVISLSTAISEELKDYNIKVYIICPGRTATPLRTILAPDEDPTTIMQPKAVSDFIVMCLNDVANVIEGQPLIVRERF